MKIKLFRRVLTLFLLLCLGMINMQGERKFDYEVMAGVSLNNYVGEDCEDILMKLGFNAAFAARYYIIKNLFVESGLGFATKGYRHKQFTSTGSTWIEGDANYDSEVKASMSTYNLDLPAMIGYKVNISDDLNLKVKLGPYITYALSGEKTIKGYITTYPDIHSSETEHFDYTYKLDDLRGFSDFGWGISAGVDVNYRALVFSAKFQRGLSKVSEDNEEYEQNILLSIGYKF